MKTSSIFFLSLACTFFSVQLFAETRTVSNNPNIPAQYTSLQTAIDESNPNDTILVHGSPVSYGNITIQNSLVLIGPGYFPTGQNGLKARMEIVTVHAATDGQVDNFVMIGMEIAQFRPHALSGCGIGFGVKTRMERCLIETVSPYTPTFGSNDSELIAVQCVFTSTFTAQGACSGAGLANIIINNSIFTGHFQCNNSLVSVVVNNSYFLGGNSALGTMQNAIMSNCIFYGTNINGGAKTNCSFNNNLTFSTNNNELALAPNVTSGTLVNINPQFVNGAAPNSGQNYTTIFTGINNYNIQESSPAINAGTDGTNIGITGGNTGFNYLTQGSRKGPNMTNLTINNSSLPVNGTLNVNFDARIQE